MKATFEHAVPILRVGDMNIAVEYYVEVLGFSKADWGTDTFTFVTRDTAGIYLCHDGQVRVSVTAHRQSL